MKIQLLPSSFDEDGRASARQHLSCFVVNDCVAFDAGSLAMAASSVQKEQIRDVVLSHAHLDHVAGLPLFIDDLFAGLKEPLRIHATAQVIEILERDIFNWDVYPRFSELSNQAGAVVEYRPFGAGNEFSVRGLRVETAEVNHKVPSVGFVISDGEASLAISNDTAETDEFWRKVNAAANLKAILVECAFPNELSDLADESRHLSPARLCREIRKCSQLGCPVYVINIKPAYREQVVAQLADLKIENLEVLEVGKIYEW